jgi:5-methylcytosine-specific restriction endonuclease McrA
VPDRQPSPISAASWQAPGGVACREPISVVGPPDSVGIAVDATSHDVVPMARQQQPTWGRRRVLLLNATFEPLTALPLRRAVVLVVCGKAEVLHGDSAGLVLHSANRTVQVPSVIKLSTYVRVPYRARVPLTRAGLMYRDRYRCAYCGGRADTIDHVIPRSRGGAHSWQNCVASCAKCNHRKADRLLSELGWRLRTAPSAPHGPNWRLLAGVAEADPLWLPYLGEPAA